MIAVLALVGAAEAGFLDKPREPFRGRYAYAPYVDPYGSLGLYRASNGASAIGLNLGLEGGVSYKDLESILAGKTRARAGLFLPGGYDLRLGSFLGPVTEYWSVQAGVDPFYNVNTNFQLDGSFGVDFPVVATLGPQNAYLLVGVTSAWLADTDRRVDWDRRQEIGFGHEFGWQLGGMVQSGRFHMGLSYSRRITAGGVMQGLGATIGF